NQHSAKFWRRALLRVIARYQDLKFPKFFRGDAAFASPKLMKLLEAEGSHRMPSGCLQFVTRRSAPSLAYRLSEASEAGVRPGQADEDGQGLRPVQPARAADRVLR